MTTNLAAFSDTATEAAAASGAIVAPTFVLSKTITISITHLFIFLIREIQTGIILFLGRVLNPFA